MGPSDEIKYSVITTQHDLPSYSAAKLRRFSGWRGTVAAGSLAAFLVLSVNLAVLAWSWSQFSPENGVATVFEGSCAEGKRISTWVHLAINILSSLLLAASNTGMQCLVAPTREEIGRRHTQRRYLDIGVHTLRNMMSIQGKRVWMWALLGLSSVPLHLVYNSVIFEITNGNTFDMVLVGRDFETGGFWNKTQTQCFDTVTSSVADVIEGMQENIDGLIRLDNAACLQAYGAGVQSGYSNVAVVSSQQTAENILNIIRVEMGGLSNNWVCDHVGGGTQYCDLAQMVKDASSWQLPGFLTDDSNYNVTTDPYGFTSCSGSSTPASFPISHCLAQPATQDCRIGISVYLLIIVIVCNAFKALCLLLMVFKLKFQPLVTIGDAISSFLDHPDTSTAGYCTLSKAEIDGWTNNGVTSVPKPWHEKHMIGFSAASVSRWVFCSILFVAFWCLALGLLFSGITSLRGDGVPTTFAELKSFGIGKPVLQQMISLTSGYTLQLAALPVDVVVANLPQLLISMLYLLYNDLFTRMQLSKEWAAYSVTRKSLRVSQPLGQQRSTRFLQLPFIYSVPLLVVMIVLHWLVSQSIFIALIDNFDYSSGGAPVDHGLNNAGLGWSPLGIMLSLVVGGLMIVALWLHALLLRYPNSVPLAGSCSAAISAACHRPDWDVDAARRPLMYGVVGHDIDTGVGHASFSSGEVQMLTFGSLYAGNTWIGR